MLRITAILVLASVVCVMAKLIPLTPMIRGACIDEKNKTAALSLVCCPGWKEKRLTNSSNFFIYCKPICDKCTFGMCVAPNVCKCNSGYISNSWGDCVSFCSATSKDGDYCNGGECKDGKCVCTEKRHIPSDDNKYCEPLCVGGCGEGGVCWYPGKCRCKKDYKLKAENLGKPEEFPTEICVPKKEKK